MRKSFLLALIVNSIITACAQTDTPAPTPAPTPAGTPAPSSSSSSDTCAVSDSCSSLSCSAGHEPVYSLTDLTISCEPCTYNFYKNESGATECDACEGDKVSDLGATECVCPTLYYMDESGDCQLCPSGVDCTSIGADISTLVLDAGYWRIDSSSSEVLECPEPSACLGGELSSSSSSSSTSTSRRRLTTSSFEGDAYCADGYEGILCAVCQDGYYAVGSECRSCDAGNKASKIISITILAAALTIFVLLVLRGQQPGSNDDDEDSGPSGGSALTAASSGNGCVAGAVAAVKRKGDTLVVKAKILITHLQVVVQLPAVLDVAFPQTFTRFTEAFNVLNFDFWGILSQGCFFQNNFYKQLASVTFMPVGIIGLLFLNYFFRRRRAGGPLNSMWDKTISGVLLTTFFFYTAVSTTILQTFNCQQFDDGNKYLVADYTIACDSRKYKAFAAYAAVMTLLFPIGVPLLYAVLLFKDRSYLSPALPQPAALEARLEDGKVQYTRFLWETYRPKAYLFEAWECVRKLLLTGLLVYFKPGTPTQVVIALLIALIAMRVLTAFRPFKRADENSLAESSMWVLFFTLFSALLIDSGVTESDGYNVAAVGVVMSLLNLGLLVLAVLQTFWSASLWLSDQLEALKGETNDGNGSSAPAAVPGQLAKERGGKGGPSGAAAAVAPVAGAEGAGHRRSSGSNTPLLATAEDAEDGNALPTTDRKNSKMPASGPAAAAGALPTSRSEGAGIPVAAGTAAGAAAGAGAGLAAAAATSRGRRSGSSQRSLGGGESELRLPRPASNASSVGLKPHEVSHPVRGAATGSSGSGVGGIGGSGSASASEFKQGAGQGRQLSATSQNSAVLPAAAAVENPQGDARDDRNVKAAPNARSAAVAADTFESDDEGEDDEVSVDVAKPICLDWRAKMEEQSAMYHAPKGEAAAAVLPEPEEPARSRGGGGHGRGNGSGRDGGGSGGGGARRRSTSPFR